MRDFLVYSGQDSSRRARRGSIRRRFRDKPGEQAAEPIPHSPQKNPLSKDEGFFDLQRSGFEPKGPAGFDPKEVQGQAGGTGAKINNSLKAEKHKAVKGEPVPQPPTGVLIER